MASSNSSYSIQRSHTTHFTLNMTTSGAGENHPDTIRISDENEERFPRTDPGNSRPRSHPQTDSRYVEVPGVLVELSADTCETTTSRKRKRTKSSEVSTLVWPDCVIRHHLPWLIKTRIMLSRSSEPHLTMKLQHCEIQTDSSKMNFAWRGTSIKSYKPNSRS